MKPLGSATTDAEGAAEVAFQAVGAWQGQDITYEAGPASVVSPIHRAVEAHCFRVRAGERMYFAKLRQSDMRSFFDDDAVVANCQIASDAGVSPRLFHVDPDTGLLVYAHLGDEWTWGKVDALANPTLLANVVDAKKSLHQGPAFHGSFDVFAMIAAYLKRVTDEAIWVPSDVPEIATHVREIGQAITAAGVDPKPCHGDGVASNIMIGPGEAVLLVDFDRAGNSDPYFDLGSLMLEAFQFEEDERQVLEIYEGHCADAAYHRCKLYGVADDLMWALWGFISFHHSPRKDVEFTKYAEWRLLRARWNLGDPNYARWLRQLG